jgi:hypothetical protein
MNTDTEHTLFIEAGYAYIPLKPFSKSPLVKTGPRKPALAKGRNLPSGQSCEPVRPGVFSEVTK